MNTRVSNIRLRFALGVVEYLAAGGLFWIRDHVITVR